MDNTQTMNLCLALMKADTEESVIQALKSAGYWDDEKYWRYYGDRDTNYNAIGNQQSRPDAALVEKLVNSVDACLMNECLLRGIDPESDAAPQTIQRAVARFLDETPNSLSSNAGRISGWSDSYRTKIARRITLAATGYGPREGKPCLTIVDSGEGQTPANMPGTLLSLDKRNKFRIPFVQGKFNMGGSGVLKFCGRNHVQLIISRRNPSLLNSAESSTSDRLWGFTIVRRENPRDGGRSSVYTYLAPLGAEKNHRGGEVLRFSASLLPLFPEGSEPYARQTEWGTLIKLYEYSGSGYSNTNILLRDGLLSRLDLLLPDIALPIRLHECRHTYRGHKGSFETTLNGLSVRLSDNKGENLEDGFPDSTLMKVMGEQIAITIYAFKKGRAETYRKNEGVVFTVNGQTHGYLTADFYRRKQVGLSYLADSLLIIADCGGFSNIAREDLFMNSRDRLSGGELRLQIEQALEDLLKHHEGLRALKERRRREEIESKLEDSRPLEDVLKSLLERYPSLSALFLPGSKAANPFKSIKALAEDAPYIGNRYPTYFRFKGKNYGYRLERDCSINMRCRIAFETDATNDYFKRDIDPGSATLHVIPIAGELQSIDNFSLNPYNGVATLSFRLPENCSVGDVLSFVCRVTDPSRVDPFENSITVHVKGPTEPHGGGGERHDVPRSGQKKEADVPAGIKLPKPKRVYEQDWDSYGFDQYTALKVKYAGEEGGESDDEKIVAQGPSGKSIEVAKINTLQVC